MYSQNLNHLELLEFAGRGNELQQCRAHFPLLGFNGSESLASVYFELEPGRHLGRHVDSAEELLVVLEGEVEAEVNGKTIEAAVGSLILIPRQAAHNIRNIGTGRAKVLGVFGGANQIVAEFEEAWLPANSHRVDTRDLAG